MLPVVPEVPRTQEQQYAAAILYELRAIRALLESPPGAVLSTVETFTAPIPASPDPKQRGKPRKG